MDAADGSTRLLQQPGRPTSKQHSACLGWTAALKQARHNKTVAPQNSADSMDASIVGLTCRAARSRPAIALSKDSLCSTSCCSVTTWDSATAPVSTDRTCSSTDHSIRTADTQRQGFWLQHLLLRKSSSWAKARRLAQCLLLQQSSSWAQQCAVATMAVRRHQLLACQTSRANAGWCAQLAIGR
jgi:hypothetical protein